MASKDNKFLTFALGEEIYGIHILKVKEIIGMMDITNVPKVQNFMKGVINLRGKIIPIIDLRLKLNLPERAYDDRTCIIVIEIETKSAKRINGIVVDTVKEVIEIDPKDIELPPQFGIEGEQLFLAGLGNLKDKVVMILETEEILKIKEMSMVNELKV